MASQSNGDVLQKAGDIWKFLDSMSVSNPAEYQKFIDKVLTDGNDNNMGPPVPRMVIQTEKVPAVIPARKYYINLAEWKQMPPPESKTRPVQIASSDSRKEIIEKEWAVTIDVVVNPVLFQKDVTSFIEDAALIELVLKFIESKQLISLSRKYKVLTDKYEGNQDNLLNFMCPSALKNSLSTALNSDKSNSMFEQLKHLSNNNTIDEKTEVIAENTPNKKSVECNINLNSKINSKHENEAKQPRFDPIITGNNTTPAIKEMKTKSLKNAKKLTNKLKTPKVEMLLNKTEKNVELNIYLPGVESVQECDLNLTENNVMLLVDGKYDLDLMLPVDINIDESNAKFVKDQQILSIKASFTPS